MGEYAVCIGFFDGVHRGHRFLLEHLRDEAHRNGLQSAVVTFANHPRKLVQPDFDLQLINTLDEKLSNLAQTGIDACFVLDFTEEMRRFSAEWFIQEILSQQLHVRRLLIGYDHRFGHNRAEGFFDYVRYGRECGIEVVQEPVFEDGTGLRFSSSEVRRALLAGEVQKAAAILGQDYQLKGKVVHGRKIGRQLGFRTANLAPADADKIVPAHGVYAAWVTLKDNSAATTEAPSSSSTAPDPDKTSVWPAMLNIGQRPTVANTPEATIEAHLIGFDGDLYGREIQIAFVQKMRDERKMQSLAELQEQLTRDRAHCLTLLGK